eukprot:TRINITY_DN2676_c0_g1_i1.p1 TRINITY_DN2676_c0_g1~~TRINITY_DN2676_c0_g1_i1.p1  ORF type:complete len:240 (-),score=45.38 TRINITY_DN2676_c0_g1_i1:38-703(-)
MGRRKWWVIDAEQHRVGRLATEISTVLQGKYKPVWTPSRDVGDYVVVINADKVSFTGNKWKQKHYIHHTGWPSGLRAKRADEFHAKKPGSVLQKAVWGMLPKNRTRRARNGRLFCYPGVSHPHGDIPKWDVMRTVPRTLYPAWEYQNTYKVSFEKVKDENDEERWILSAESRKVDPKVRKQAKRKGLLGKSHRTKNHPDFADYELKSHLRQGNNMIYNQKI